MEKNLKNRQKISSCKDPRQLENDLNIHVPSYPYKSSGEYIALVNQWLWQCYNWQSMALNFPYVLTHSTVGFSTPIVSTPIVTNANSGAMDLNRNFPNNYFPNQNLFLPQSQRVNDASFQSINEQTQGTEFLIPSLLKRLTAEVIDFCILLVLKVIITYIAVEFFNLVNLDKYDLDLIKNDEVDYQKAVQVTSEIIALEIVHRFVVCLFEALCIYKGMFGNGGATPGKTLLRLKVVSCHSVVSANSNVVRVYPAGDLGIGWALLRAFIKNFSMAFIFPIFFTMYFFQHNRTAYDIICNSIVVEELPEPRNRQQ